MFTPITNPYIVGNPIKTKKMFYGREDDFEFIRRKLESGSQSYIIVLSGERRSGKTSILFQILNGRLGDNFIPILIDMQTMAGLKNEAEFFEKFAIETIKNLDESLKQKRYDFSSKEYSPYKVFSQLLDDIHAVYPQKNKIFLIDEYELIETKSQEGSLSPNFVPFLSGILESDRHISFIFTGSRTLQERGTPFWQNLFGKSLFRNVSFLSEQDTFRLISEPVKEFITYDEKVLNSIYRLTSGQPFYTQIVGQNIVDFVNEHERTQITLEDLEQIVNEILENPLPQMIYFWNSLPQSQMLMMSLLAEILEDAGTEIKPDEMIKETKKKKLGLELDSQIVNTILESLYHIKYVSKTNNGYSFQIDLMRQWIKRDHSIWRVMKEVDIESIMISERPTSSLTSSGDSRIESGNGGSIKKWLIPLAAIAVLGTAGLWWLLSGTPEKKQPGDDVTEQVIGTSNAPQENIEQLPPPVEKPTQKPVSGQSSRSISNEPAQRKVITEPKITESKENAVPDRQILEQKNAMLERKSEAERIQAPVFAGQLFSQAEKSENEAENLMRRQEYRSAGEKYAEAEKLFADATVKSTGALEQTKSETEALRLQAQDEKSKLQATHRELDEYQNAETLMAQADGDVRDKNYISAQKDYSEAIKLYKRSLTRRDEQSEQIKAAIREYIAAIERENIDQASAISKNYREELKNQWEPFFNVADDIKIDYTINDIGFKGNGASVLVDVTMNFSGAGGAGNRNKWKIDLGESGTQWLITKISEAN